MTSQVATSREEATRCPLLGRSQGKTANHTGRHARANWRQPSRVHGIRKRNQRAVGDKGVVELLVMLNDQKIVRVVREWSKKGVTDDGHQQN